MSNNKEAGNLVIKRRAGESVVIYADGREIKVTQLLGDKMSISADKDVQILRQELAKLNK